MLWWTPTQALPIERSEWNAMSMSSLGDNVVSDGASVLMFSQNFTKKEKTRKNKTTRQSLMVPSLTSSFYWEERGLQLRCGV